MHEPKNLALRILAMMASILSPLVLATDFSDPILNDPAYTQYNLSRALPLYKTHCESCHGDLGRGTPGFPSLRDDDWLHGGGTRKIIETIENGRKGAMPAHADGLTEEQIDTLARWVVDMSETRGKGGSAEGWSEFRANGCEACHGKSADGILATLPDGEIVTVGAANLTDSVWRFEPGGYESARHTILYGVNQPGVELSRITVMPSFSAVLTELDIVRLAILVKTFKTLDTAPDLKSLVIQDGGTSKEPSATDWLEMDDGSQVTGVFQNEEWRFESIFGALTIPVRGVLGYQDGALILADGSSIKGTFKDSSIKLQAIPGAMDLPAKRILRFIRTVPGPDPASSGKTDPSFDLVDRCMDEIAPIWLRPESVLGIRVLRSQLDWGALTPRYGVSFESLLWPGRDAIQNGLEILSGVLWLDREREGWTCSQLESVYRDWVGEQSRYELPKITADVIWDGDAAGVYEKCEHGDDSCVFELMRSTGASEQAIRFGSRVRGWAYELEELGPIDVVSWVQTFAASVAGGQYLVNGTPELIDISSYELRDHDLSRPDVRAVLSQVGEGSLFNHRFTRMEPKAGGQRFIVEADLVQCNACRDEVQAVAEIVYDLDSSGFFQQVSLRSLSLPGSVSAASETTFDHHEGKESPVHPFEGLDVAQDRIEVSDGSRVLGKMADLALGFKSSIGTIRVKTSEILSFEHGVLRLKDTSLFKGRFKDDEIELRGSIGHLEVEASKVTRIYPAGQPAAVSESAQAPSGSGSAALTCGDGTTPQATFEVIRVAARLKDLLGFFDCLTPGSQQFYTGVLLLVSAVMHHRAGPWEPVQHKPAGLDELKSIFEKYLDEIDDTDIELLAALGMTKDPEESLKIAKQIAALGSRPLAEDPSLLRQLSRILDQAGLGADQVETIMGLPPYDQTEGLENVRMTKDRAEGSVEFVSGDKLISDVVHFTRIEGRWLMNVLPQ